MATYLPSTFGWSPPHVRTSVTDEPDYSEVAATALYDAPQGLLGSTIRMQVAGSGDETVCKTRVLTQVRIRLAQAVPAAATGVHVVAHLRCEDASAYVKGTDEPGVSSLTASYVSRPFAQVLKGKAAPQYDGSVAAAGAAFIDKVPMIGIKGSDFTLGEFPQRGDAWTFSVELDDVSPTRGLLIAVGLDDEAVVESNDVSYTLGATSSWTLESVDLVTY